MISDVEDFFQMSIGHLYVLFGEVSIQVLCPFFKNLISVAFFPLPFSPLIPTSLPAITTLLSMSMSPFSFLLNPSTPYPPHHPAVFKPNSFQTKSTEEKYTIPLQLSTLGRGWILSFSLLSCNTGASALGLPRVGRRWSEMRKRREGSQACSPIPIMSQLCFMAWGRTKENTIFLELLRCQRFCRLLF